MNRKKIIGLCLAMVLSIGGLAACSSTTNDDTAQSTTTTEQTTIQISGSTSVFPLMDAVKDMYMEDNPNVKVQVEQGGSGVGIANAKDGVSDIGMASRNLKDDEKPMGETIWCLDGIAVVVNSENPVKELTMEQIAKIYKGEITNWKDVGGDDADITLITREATSGTRGAFEELVLDEQVIDDTKCLVQNSNGNAASSVESDKNAIGYISLGIVKNYSKLVAVSVDGVEATAENVKSGDYKISRPFLLVTAEEEPTGAVADFLEYITTNEDVQNFIQEENYILK